MIRVQKETGKLVQVGLVIRSWNEYMWPLAVLTPDNPTVQLSINNLANAYFKDYTLMFAGTTVRSAAHCRNDTPAITAKTCTGHRRRTTSGSSVSTRPWPRSSPAR